MDLKETKYSGCRIFRRFLDSDDASTAIEYAILIGLISVTLMPVVRVLAEKVRGVNESVASALAGEADSGSNVASSSDPTTTESGYNPASEEATTQ